MPLNVGETSQATAVPHANIMSNTVPQARIPLTKPSGPMLEAPRIGPFVDQSERRKSRIACLSDTFRPLNTLITVFASEPLD
jgi:hypothetical protein